MQMTGHGNSLIADEGVMLLQRKHLHVHVFYCVCTIERGVLKKRTQTRSASGRSGTDMSEAWRACDTGVNTGPCSSFATELAMRHAPEASRASAQARTPASVTTPPSASTALFRYIGVARPA